jgi:predicted double-glycine peptidase
MQHPLSITLLFTALVASACSSTQPRRALSSDAHVLDCPIVQQEDEFGCGLTAVSALCAYWNVEIPAEERARLEKLASKEEGLSGDELEHSLANLGFETYLFRGTLDHEVTGLLAQADARRPALVMLAPEPNRHHYVLFIGYDESERNACLLDPVRGRVIVPYETFETSWSGCKHFTLLAVPVSKGTASTTSSKDPS